MYATLKDADAALDAVCWKGTLARLSVRPEEGMEVIATGRLTTYPARSNYQLVIEDIALAGAGALLAMLEARKRALAAEGLFAAERKRPLPFLPARVGVVTSPSGAVIRDILHRLADRFPRHVLVWPAAVQGAAAEGEVAAGIAGLAALPEGMRPEVIIVARGGGSLEDLMPFNAEAVVRAAAACPVPLISAVGHETDTTLLDFAADARAPTPTAAAEMAVPVRADLRAQVADRGARLARAAARALAERAQRADGAAARLGRPERALEAPAQRLDFAATGLERAYGALLAGRAAALEARAGRLTHPRRVVEAAEQALARAWGRLPQAAARVTDGAARRVEATARVLESLSFERTLERGYAIVRDSATGAPVTATIQARPGQRLTLLFAGGQALPARVEEQAELF